MRISDWSSDVCSSDLGVRQFARKQKPGALDLGDQPTQFGFQRVELVDELRAALADIGAQLGSDAIEHRHRHVHGPRRAEERRVGKEWCSTCRYRGTPNL